MQALKIVLVSVLVAITYGIVHDQITARLSLEYFTVAHPRLPVPQTPTMLGLAWGVLATWWVGLGLGVLLALAARGGSFPKLELRDLRAPLTVFVVLLFVVAIMALAMGWAGAVGEKFHPPETLRDQIPRERWRHFVAASWAHTASYGFGALGGLALCAHVLLVRRKRVRTTQPR